MNAETTLCTCIEAGALEEQVMLLLESLRQFGGRYANLPFVAVRARTGPALAGATRRHLERFGAELVEKPLNRTYAWWPHANKPAAMRYVERHAQTPCVTWMDSDMAVLREPRGFAPAEGADFVARAGEAYDVASNGADDRAAFWEQLCRKFGLDFASFPTITSFPDAKPIRAYWQTGLFTYRRPVRFAERYLEIMGAVLDGAIASRLAGTYHTDQVSAALAVQALGLRVEHYDPRMNFNLNPLDKAASEIIPIGEVEILHYHGSFWPRDYAWARGLLEALPTDRVELIDRHAPHRGPGLLVKAQRKLFDRLRAGKVAAYERRVVRY